MALFFVDRVVCPRRGVCWLCFSKKRNHEACDLGRNQHDLAIARATVKRSRCEFYSSAVKHVNPRRSTMCDSPCSCCSLPTTNQRMRPFTLASIRAELSRFYGDERFTKTSRISAVASTTTHHSQPYLPRRPIATVFFSPLMPQNCTRTDTRTSNLCTPPSA